MKWSSAKVLLCAVLLLGGYLQAAAQKIPARPSPQRLVNDFAGVLSAADKERLEQKLKAFDDSTTNQIAIVIEKAHDPDGPVSLEDYVHDLFNAWGIGRAKKDNGVLIYVAAERRKMRIEVGYGLNTIITASRTGRIITDILVPNFQKQDYYTGLDQATDALMALARREFPAELNQKHENDKPSTGFIAVIILFIIIILLATIFGRRGGGGGGRRGRSWDNFRGGWGPFVGGGWGGGGFGGFGGGGGGGGFGGFGGGMSGGGGASGSW